MIPVLFLIVVVISFLLLRHRKGRALSAAQNGAALGAMICVGVAILLVLSIMDPYIRFEEGNLHNIGSSVPIEVDPEHTNIYQGGQANRKGIYSLLCSHRGSSHRFQRRELDFYWLRCKPSVTFGSGITAFSTWIQCTMLGIREEPFDIYAYSKSGNRYHYRNRISIPNRDRTDNVCLALSFSFS